METGKPDKEIYFRSKPDYWVWLFLWPFVICIAIILGHVATNIIGWGPSYGYILTGLFVFAEYYFGSSKFGIIEISSEGLKFEFAFFSFREALEIELSQVCCLYMRFAPYASTAVVKYCEGEKIKKFILGNNYSQRKQMKNLFEIIKSKGIKTGISCEGLSPGAEWKDYPVIETDNKYFLKK